MSESLAIIGHNITTPGKMTIIKSMGRLNFYPNEVQILNTLEEGKVYNLNVDFIYNSMWLSEAPQLNLPPKIYDFEQDFRNQVLNTLRLSESNMNIGVALVGYKGQGKSVMAKQLAIESGLPIVLINGSIPKAADFVDFLQEIKQDYCLLVDEFEKIFLEPGNPSGDKESDNKMHTQNSFLSLLDGTFSPRHKRLTILTSNKDIGDKFINRPSRIRYYKKYDFMKPEVFRAIIDDKLINKHFSKDLEDNLDIPSCTIDLLTSIVDEINIHNKPYSEFKHFFNHKENKVHYTKYMMVEGKWEYQEELELKKEIGVETESLYQFVPAMSYNSKILFNDGEKIVYEDMFYTYDEDDNVKEKKKVTYKLQKMKYISAKNGYDL